MHPYRTPAETDATARTSLDAGLGWVALVVWAGSVVRATAVVMRHEPLSQELALAFVLALSIPLLARRARDAAHPQTPRTSSEDLT